MKDLRLGGLVAVMVVAAAALIIAGTASATVLCKEEKNPCGLSDYPAGTELKVEQMPENTMRWKAGESTVDECTGSKFIGKTSNTGGLGINVLVPLSTFTFGSCPKTREITKFGQLEIFYVSTEEKSQAWIVLSQLTWKEGACTYEGKNITIGAIRKPESGKTTVLIDAVFPLLSGLGCSSTITFEATYKVITPLPLYVFPS
jgi:hypothetical protein